MPSTGPDPESTAAAPEQVLGGGRSFGAVRVGDTVRRPAQRWTPAVHALLDHLQAVGFDGAPRVVGFDDQGREILTYLPGEVVGDDLPWPAWVYSDAALVQVGRWTRRLHDATIDFVPPPDAIWFGGQHWRPGLIAGHHDAGPYNAVWSDAGLVGFVDWDTAGPSSRELDLAFVALTWVPLCTRPLAERQGFTAFEDRSRRLHVLLDAYGYQHDRTGLGAAVIGRARLNASAIRELAASGVSVYVALLPAADDLEQAAAEIEALPPEFWAAVSPPPAGQR